MDEAFLDVSHVGAEHLLDYGRQIRDTVWQCTGIPVSVGIATTKTLSKIATEVAKQNHTSQGVLNLTQYSEAELDELLDSIALKDVWGIGSRFISRMVGGEIAPSAANSEPYVKVSLHTAPQCMVIVIDTCLRHLLRAVHHGNVDEEQRDWSRHCCFCLGLYGRSL